MSFLFLLATEAVNTEPAQLWNQLTRQKFFFDTLDEALCELDTLTIYFSTGLYPFIFHNGLFVAEKISHEGLP